MSYSMFSLGEKKNQAAFTVSRCILNLSGIVHLNWNLSVYIAEVVYMFHNICHNFLAMNWNYSTLSDTRGEKKQT